MSVSTTERFAPIEERYNAMLDTVNTTIGNLQGEGEVAITVGGSDLAIALKSLGQVTQDLGGYGDNLVRMQLAGMIEDDQAPMVAFAIEQAYDHCIKLLDATASIVAAVQGTAIPDEMPGWLSDLT